jgi:hypothetical protein
LEKLETVEVLLTPVVTQNDTFMRQFFDAPADQKMEMIMEQDTSKFPGLVEQSVPLIAEIYLDLANSKQIFHQILLTTNTASSNLIEVAIKPNLIIITQQPPLVVYVGDLFQVDVVVKSTDFTIPEAPVMAGVVNVGDTTN